MNPAPAALERLAARATFDELASIVAQLQTRVDASLLVLRVTGPPTPTLASLREIFRPIDRTADRLRLVPAVRVRPDLAVAQLTPADRVQDIVASDGRPEELGVDPVRLIGLVRVPASADPSAVWRSEAEPPSPRYVAVAEATPGGPALRPLFLGRTDPLNDVRWKRPLLALGGAGVTQPGALIFSLDGVLEGLAVLEESLPAMAPASALLSAVDDLEQGRVTIGGDYGFQVEDLRPSVAAAVGTSTGAVVNYVRTGGPADGQLRVGDVITAFNGAPMFAAEPLLVEMSRTPPGTRARLTVVRDRQPVDVTLTIGPPADQTPPAAPASDEPGMILRAAPRVGAEVLRVLAASPARVAGLRPGDVITSLDGTPAPSASDVERAYRGLQPGASLLLGVSRQGEPTVLALHKP